MTSNKTDLESIKGIGSSRAKDIREELDVQEVKGLAQLSKEELKNVPGIGEKRAEKILKEVDKQVEGCSHCGSLTYFDETCGACLQQLERSIERIEDILKDVPEDERERLKELLSEAQSEKESGDLSSGFESLDRLESEIQESIKKTEDDLTQVKGIGTSRAKKLKDELDVSEVKELTELSKEELAQVKGVGEKKAKTIIEGASKLLEECDRCGSKVRKGKTCLVCDEELERILDGWKEEIEELDRSYGIRSTLEKKLDEAKKLRVQGDLGEAFELTHQLEEDIKNSEKTKTLLQKLEKKIDEERDLIDFSIFNKRLEGTKRLLEKGRYERGVKKAEKSLEYLENEKRLALMDKEELADLGIEDFCRQISGPRSITGEKIYKSGFNTVRKVAKAGAARIEKEADIDEDMASIIIKRINDFLGEEEFEFEDKIDEELEELEEEEKKDLAEEVFQEAEVLEEETGPKVESAKEMFEEIDEKGSGKEMFEELDEYDRKRGKRKEKIPEKKPEMEPEEKRARTEEKDAGKKIIKSVPKEESETIELSKIYWIPAIVIPIIFFLLGLFIFVL